MKKQEKVNRFEPGHTRVHPSELRMLTRRDFLKFTGLFGAGVAASSSLLMPATSLLAQDDMSEAVVVYGATHEMESIDPAVGYTLWSRYVTDNVYDSLFRFEGIPPQVVNHLAKSHEVSDDGLEWIFHLEENVSFHDGTMLTASDVKYTFERMLAMGDSPSFLWAATVDPDQIEVIDDHTLKLVLKKQFGPFLFTLPWLYIVNEDLVRANEVDGDWGRAWMRDNDAGSGPFYIEEFDPAVRIVHSWFEEYWKGWPEDHLTGWVWEIHREPATLRQLLENGQVHMTDRLSQIDYELVAALPQINVIEQVTLSPGMVKMNNQKEPTSNVDFRRAMNYAFDYQAAIAGVLNGNGTRLTSPLPKGFPGQIDISPYETNLDLAREHLEKSGYNPAELELVYNYVGGAPIQQDFGLVLQNSLQKLGINVVVEGLPVGEYIGRLNAPDTAAHFNWIWASSDYPDAEIIFFPQYHSSNWGAWYSCTFYKNERADELIDLARVTVDEAARIEMYHELQQILIDDAADIWVYARHFLMAMNMNVEGFRYQPAGMDSSYFYPMALLQ